MEQRTPVLFQSTDNLHLDQLRLENQWLREQLDAIARSRSLLDYALPRRNKKLRVRRNCG